MYAIVKTGGKQYKVEKGDVLFVEKLDAKEGDTVTLDVLMTADGKKTTVGSPLLDDMAVEAKVLAQGKDRKVTVFHYKAKKNVRKKSGHRQPHTKLEIVSIAKTSKKRGGKNGA